MKKIAFAGTDGRTLLSALTVATATSENSTETYEGIVVRGTPAMPIVADELNWPVRFIPTASNHVNDYAASIIDAMQKNEIDLLVPMPEALLFEGLVDRVKEVGFENRILGLSKEAAFVEGDKIRCKELCREGGVPVADEWVKVDAKNKEEVIRICLDYLHRFGGAVLKYPYSAGGKGARIITSTWDVSETITDLVNDYKEAYTEAFGKKGVWPLLIESRMAGVEISFTILADSNGCFQILPTAMDYPERFAGPPGKSNPITGGVGAISPHPMETPALLKMAADTIAAPLVNILKKKGYLRPCILYPGCFVSLDHEGNPTAIRVAEVNIRPGEPEAQPVMRRLRNLGDLLMATIENRLDQVIPEVREDQIAANIALVTGPGGPDGQKGYPWRCTKGEKVEIDFGYLKKKGIQLIVSAMTTDEGVLKSDGTRVAFLNANATVKETETPGVIGERLHQKLMAAFEQGKIRVIPRENEKGNRLDVRRDIALQYQMKEALYPRKK